MQNLLIRMTILKNDSEKKKKKNHQIFNQGSCTTHRPSMIKINYHFKIII